MNEALKAKLKEESDAAALCSEVFTIAKQKKVSIPTLIKAMVIRYGCVEAAIAEKEMMDDFYDPF